MEIRTLKYFVSAYETGSITAASQACHVAQPSISQAIQKLEGELHCTLLIREKTGVTPTEAGNLLYQHAKRLLADSDSIISLFKPAPSKTKRLVNLDVHLPLSRFNWVLDVLSKTAKDTRWHFVNDTPNADLHLCSITQCPPGYDFIPLWKDDYCLLTPDSLRFDFKTTGWEGLQKLEFIERPFCENRHLWVALQQKLGLTLTVSAQAPTEEWAQLMVAKGFGVCFAPIPSDKVAGIRVVPLPFFDGFERPTRTLGWAVSPGYENREILVGGR
jgi:DNA-binding transcriptional LysR family regulator